MKGNVNLFRVGNQWYYIADKWKGTVGPFKTLQEASEALTYELENNNGKETRWSLSDLGPKEQE